MAEILTENLHPPQSPHTSPIKSPWTVENNATKSPKNISSSSDDENVSSLFDKIKKRTHKIVSDSDSEHESFVNKSDGKGDSQSGKNDDNKSTMPSYSDDAAAASTNNSKAPKRKSRIRKFSGSSSESDTNPTPKNIQKFTNSEKEKISSDSDSNSRKSTLQKNKMSSDSDSDEGSIKVSSQKSNSEVENDNSVSQVPTWKKLVDSESDSDASLPSIRNNYSEHGSSPQAIRNKKSESGSKDSVERKKKQMTQKQRDELMKETLSKTQKMQREAQLALPYHKPKQLTLKEFLAKRAKDKVQFYTSLKENENTKAELTHSKKLTLPSQSKVDEWSRTAASVPLPEDNSDLEEESISPNNLLTIPSEDKVEEWIQTSVTLDPDPMELGNEDDEEPTKTGNADALQPETISMDLESQSSEKEINKSKDIGKNPQPLVIQIKQEKLLENESQALEIGSDDEDNIEFVDLGLTDDEESEKDKTYPEPSPSRIETIITVNDGQKLCSSKNMKPIHDFDTKEAELDSYLTSNKVSTKKNSNIRDLLKSMPNYQKVANLNPVIKPDSSTGVIQLSILDDKTKRKKLSKKKEQIEAFKNRFLKHCIVPKKPTDQHFTVLVEKRGEDSQGNQTSVFDKVDYVQHTNEESDNTKSSSPYNETSGSRFSKYRENLRDKIRATKVKEYQEKAKQFAIYNNEKVLEDKPELEEEEEAEFSTESEPELTDEELEVARLKKKKKKPKSAFVDEEAEVSDGPEGDDEEEEEDDDDEVEIDPEESMKNNEDDEQAKKSYRRVQVVEDSSDEEGQSETTVSQSNDPFSNGLLKNPIMGELFSQSDNELQITPAQRPRDDDTESEPIVFESQIDPCAKSESFFARPEHSQPKSSQSSQSFPRFDSEAALSAFTTDMACLNASSKPLSTEIAKLVGATNEPDSQELMEMCSAAFPSQTVYTPEDTQATQFDFDDSELQPSYEDKEEVNDLIATPKASSTFVPMRDNETPKALEKERIHQTRLFDKPVKMLIEAPILSKLTNVKTNEDDDDDDDKGSIVGAIVKKKKRRLLFSDEEDSDSESHVNEEVDSDAKEIELFSDSEVERGYDSEENEILIPKKPALPTVSKRNIRDFVENEAELSGSEDGSADEDERGLDDMDEEDGDLEDLDEQEVADEVGRIHARKLMDDDDKQVRLLQEILLEDGDLHGEGTTRERQFKWKNIDSELPGDNNIGNEEDEQNGECEDEAEKLWQEQKAEKAKWLKDNPQFIEDEQEEIEQNSEIILKESSQIFKLGKSTVKKLHSFLSESTSMSMSFTSTSQSFNKNSSSVTENSDSNTNTSSHTNQSLSNESKRKFGFQTIFSSPDEPVKKFRHGSFLTRGNPTLSKLAEMTKVNDHTSNVKTNSRNFVFSVVTPPSETNADGNKQSKRKAARQPLPKSQPKKIPRTENASDAKMKRSASIFNHL